MKRYRVTPAYGRKYQDVRQVIRDWQAGKDFRSVATGQYMSIAEAHLLKKDGYEAIEVKHATHSHVIAI